MARNDPEPDLTILQRALPDGCGVVVYARASSPPWKLRSVVGDATGVLGVPSQTLETIWGELVHPEDEARVTTTLAGLQPEERTSIEYRVRTGLTGERWVRDSLQRLPGASGLIIGAIKDVSTERTLRSQVAALEERIWQSQRVDSLGSLATGIAHDLGNLLTAVLSAIQLVEESDEIPPSVLDDLAVARESARRGAEFVKQILRFAAREEYTPGPVDLNHVVENLRLILSRSLGTDVRLVIDKAVELPRVSCDPGQMEQVLLNLAVNAREAMPIGGQLSITTRVERLVSHMPVHGATLPAGDYVVLSVADTGKGIPAHVTRRIFEPFFSTKTRKGSGSGFGLSTVQRIVHSHAGGVDVASIEGQGTTFHIYQPVRAGSLVRSENGTVHAPAPSEVPSLGRVLVVESDPAVRDVMKRVLARERYLVMAVGSAHDAQRMFDRVRPPFELVVTDVALPDRSGFELVDLLRARAEELRAVYVGPGGSLPQPDDVSTVYLDKPFTPLGLLSAVRRALPAAAPSQATDAGASREA